MESAPKISAAIATILEENTRNTEGWFKPGRKFSVATIFVLSALQRIASNGDGFDRMLASKNYPVMAAILRMQIDTAMRVFGLRLMNDMNAGTMALLKGEKYDSIKGRDGKALKDSVLLAAMKVKHPWVEPVYKKTSSMIHLSGTHIFHALDHSAAETSPEGTLAISLVISPTGPNHPDHIFEECGEAFLHATMIASAEALAFLKHEAEVFDRA